MRELPETLDAALDACMEAVLSPEAWHDALRQLCGALDLVGCSFNTYGAASRLALPATPAYRDMLVDYVRGGWRAHDPRSRRGWPLVAAGLVTIVDDVVSTIEERRRSPFYADFVHRHDMPHFVGIGFKIEDQLWSLSGARSARQGAPSTEYQALTEATAPHLKRIIRYSSKVGQNRRQGAIESLETLGEAAICVDFSGRVLQMTSAAESLLGDGVSVRAGRLALSDAQAESGLHHLLKVALDPGAHYSASARAVVVRRVNKQPLIAEVVPSRNAMCDPMGFAGALVLLHNLDRPRVIDESLVREMFALSKREAQVAVMIGAGFDVEDIAARLDLLASSVNQLIKAAMAKMQVHSRAELAALVVRVPRAKS